MKRRENDGRNEPVEIEDGEEYLRVEPDCTRLTKLGKSFLHEEIAAGRLKAFRFGRAVRVRRSDLRAWQESRGVLRAESDPCPSKASKDSGRRESERPTLRDRFAMAALTGICMRAEWYGDDAAATSAYEIADAMLAARGK